MSSWEAPCSFIHIGNDQPSYVDRDQLRTFSPLETRTVFHEAFATVKAQAPATREMLARLQSLSPKTASLFGCKADRLEEFVFRLIFPNPQQKIKPSSFLALSYCWQKDARLDPHDARGHSLPIPPVLFAALIKEVKSDSEGVWCDQICIDQENDEEKGVSIGMMDMVYREARRTVIALTDIEISEEEQTFLELYLKDFPAESPDDEDDMKDPVREMQNPPYMQSHLVLLRFYLKIAGSRLFQRAWCAQEFHLGRRKIFLAACKDSCTVLRMTSRFFYHLMFLGTEFMNQQPSGSTVGREHDNVCGDIWSGYSKDRSYEDYLVIHSQIQKLGCGGDPNPRLSPEQRARSALRDKMVIVLNTNHYGISLREYALDIIASDTTKSIFTDENCFKILAILSLASRDPTILCATGKPVSCSSSQSLHSWIWWDSINDHADRRSHRHLKRQHLQRIRIDENDAFLELELCDFSGAKIIHPLAKMKLYAGLLTSEMERSSKPRRNSCYDWRDVMNYSEEVADKFDSTLACILQCGIPWIVHTLSFSEKSFLYADFDQTSLRHLQESQPEWLQTMNEPGEEDIESLARNIFAWVETDEGWNAAQILLEFATYIAVASLPDLQLARAIKTFQPVLLSRSNDKKYIIFLDSHCYGPFITVPNALLEDRFESLNRVWILEVIQNEGKGQCHLVGRQRIFGPSFVDMGHEEESTKRLRVYGPRA